jgi:hypothetical protein
MILYHIIIYDIMLCYFNSLIIIRLVVKGKSEKDEMRMQMSDC